MKKLLNGIKRDLKRKHFEFQGDDLEALVSKITLKKELPTSEVEYLSDAAAYLTLAEKAMRLEPEQRSALYSHTFAFTNKMKEHHDQLEHIQKYRVALQYLHFTLVPSDKTLTKTMYAKSVRALLQFMDGDYRASNAIDWLNSENVKVRTDIKLNAPGPKSHTSFL